MPVIFDQPFQILLNLAREKKIDPWDVEIDKVADLYAAKIREMKKLDLRVSGRALLSASVLLRMKANTPPYNGHSEKKDEMLEDLEFDMPELGPITIIRQDGQKISLSDLTKSLQEVMEESPKNEDDKKKTKHVKKIMREIDDYNINIEKHIQEFHEKIALLGSNGEKINFMQLLPEENRLEIVRNLLLALFLSAEGKISISQEDHFGDIYIKLLEMPEESNNGN
ncbi:hypothetical protein AKJ55_01660 [candidate division MSBL1 archaeon SCGC-AAA382M17]|uniref:Rad21/Rec8-like protein C-terminal eukaryotic domain-containing protein n=1 Tax=candidate division MSBL1 archaeon SCGC-AAA382M17 TaxID=1698284 RepID=A0ABR5TJ95_9EURY|nr:hypothetical protein AKJ55_01660 [candidate division MSBL1 archaeon SCGC-AAA382M17]